VSFFGHMVQGDFGTSLRSKRPVSTEIAERFMPTLLLTMPAWCGRCSSAW
jgi:glutathione transport system permease protein